MDFLESLNQVLTEDKNSEFIASIEAFPAHELPVAHYAYAPLDAGERREVADDFADISYQRQLDKVLQHVEMTAGMKAWSDSGAEYGRSALSPIVRGQLAKLRIPAELSKRWERELTELHARLAKEARNRIKVEANRLRKQDEPDLQRKIDQYRSKELAQARAEALKTGWWTPITREEAEEIAGANRANLAQLAEIINQTSYIDKPRINPLLAQSSYDPYEFGLTQFLPDYLIRHKINPEDPEKRSAYVKSALGDNVAFREMLNQFNKRLYDFHMEHPNPGELLQKILTDVLSYETPAQATLVGSVRDLYSQVNTHTPQGITLRTLLDTLVGWGEIDLTDPSEQVVTAVVELPEEGEGQTYEGLIQTVQHALVEADFEQDPMLLLDLTLKQIQERPTRGTRLDPSLLELAKSYTKPAFRPLTNVPREEGDERPRPVELADEWARIKANNDTRKVATEFPFSWLVVTGSERAGQRGVRAQKLVKGQWVGKCETCRGSKAIQIPDGQWVACGDCGADGTDIAWYWDNDVGYEAHPAYSSRKHQQLTPFEKIFQGIWIVLVKSGLKPEAYDGIQWKSGKPILRNGMPVPQKRETHTRGASNVESYTVTIRLNQPLGNDQTGVQTNFQQKIVPALQGVLNGLGFQTKLDLVRNVESWTPPRRVNVFGYVIEPGLQELIGDRSPIEGPEQVPGQLRQYQNWTPQDRLEQGIRIYEAAQILDMRGYHQPHLWLALGMPENAKLAQIPEEERNLAFTEHLALALKSIRAMEAELRETPAHEDSPIVKLLKNWINQGDGKFDPKALPANIRGYLRAKANLDAIHASHIFGVPPEWNEIQAPKSAGKTKRAQSRALSRREDLYRRAERLNQIWSQLPEPYRSKMPGYSIMIALGLNWEVPGHIANSIAERVRLARENDIDPYQETYTTITGQEVQVIGSDTQIQVKGMKLRGSKLTDRQAMPLTYLKLALDDLKDVIADAKSGIADTGPLELSADQIDEFYRYASEIQAVIEHTNFKLLDPALKCRMRRERERMKKWEEIDRPQEIEAERSNEISRIMSIKLWGHLGTGEISDDEYYSDPTCLEVDIIQQIRQFVVGQVVVGEAESGISTEHFWQPDNIVRSIAQVSPALQSWLEREIGGAGQINLTSLVVPGTNLPINILQAILRKLQALNGDESGVREKLLVQAFQDRRDEIVKLIQRGKRVGKRGEWFQQKET